MPAAIRSIIKPAPPRVEAPEDMSGWRSSGPDDVPTPPAGLAMVIRATSGDDASLARLASLVEREPGLTAALLKLANSAAYGAGRRVGSVAQATVMLGARVLRNITIGHTVRIMARGMQIGGLDGVAFWQDSLRRACAAQRIAELAGYEDASEAFTVGLIQDIGVVLMAASAPDAGARLEAARTKDATQRLAVERAICGRTHAELFVGVAGEWGLPPEMITAVALHHSDVIDVADRRTRRLAEIARVADAVADVTQTVAEPQALARAKALLGGLPSRRPLELDVVVDAVREAMSVASADLQIGIGEQPSYEELMGRANERLIALSESYERLTQRLELALREKDELARRLEMTNRALRRLATTDPLTGVGNRRSFNEALERALEDAEIDGSSVTLLTLDIDRFKAVNDAHGHAAGDDVLVAVAERLREHVREGDFVGRIGGEEFAVALPACPEPFGQVVAERLRAALAASPVRCRDGVTISVTASFGGVTMRAGATVDAAMRRADAALYASKRAGRDRVTWANEAELDSV